MIRPATPTDTPGIVATIKAVYDEYGFTWEEGGYHADLYDLQTHYSNKGHHFWVAEQDGQIVGTVALEVFKDLPGHKGQLIEYEGAKRIGGCDCALQRLYVHPSARNQGLGTALFKKTIEAAPNNCVRTMEIWSDKRFENAHRLYERHGAKMVGDRICHDPDQSPEWGLILRLKKGPQQSCGPLK